MRRTILLIGVAVVFCALPVNAELIMIGIEGAVDYVGDRDNHLKGRVNPGDLITGTYTYDTHTPNSNPLSYNARYEHFDYPYGISLSVGGFDFRTDPANANFLIEIVNDYRCSPRHGCDTYSVTSYINLPFNDEIKVDNIVWYLRDDSETALSGIELLTTAPVPSDWHVNYIDIVGEAARTGFWLRSHITSAVVIPEPASVLLLGLGGLVFTRRTKK